MKATQLLVGSFLFFFGTLIQVGFCNELEDRYTRLSYESGLILGYSRGISALSSNLCWLDTPVSDRGSKGGGGAASAASPEVSREKLRFFKQIVEAHEARLMEVRDLIQTPFVREQLDQARLNLLDLIEAKSSQKSCQALPSVLLILGNLQIRMTEEQERLRMEIQSQKRQAASLRAASEIVSEPIPSQALKSKRVEKVDESVQVSEKALPAEFPPGVLKVEDSVQSQRASQSAHAVITPEAKHESRVEVEDRDVRISLSGVGELSLSEKKKLALEEVLSQSVAQVVKKFRHDYKSAYPRREVPLVLLNVRVESVDLRLNCFGRIEGYTAQLQVNGEVDQGGRRKGYSFRLSSALSYESKRWYKSQSSTGFQTDLDSKLTREFQKIL